MEGLKVKFGVLEKTIWILEKSWKSPFNLFLKKGMHPVTCEYERALGTLSMVVCGVKPGCARKRGHEAKRKQESLFAAKKAAVSGLVVVVTLLVWGF